MCDASLGEVFVEFQDRPIGGDHLTGSHQTGFCQDFGCVVRSDGLECAIGDRGEQGQAQVDDVFPFLDLGRKFLPGTVAPFPERGKFADHHLSVGGTARTHAADWNPRFTALQVGREFAVGRQRSGQQQQARRM